MFENCPFIRNIDIGNFDLSNASGMGKMFTNCNSLSNASLEGIVNALATTSSLPASGKTLSSLGLKQAQANICVNFDGWANAQNAGWTTGY